MQCFQSEQNHWTPAFAGVTTPELSNFMSPPAELGVYLNEIQALKKIPIRELFTHPPCPIKQKGLSPEIKEEGCT
jgi:hypothetical protein